MIRSKNIFYISNFNVIGGTENFIYELARKYEDYDITVIYKIGNLEQIRRLKKHVRVIKYQKGDVIKCKKAFFNYETDIIDDIEAEEYIQIIHAMFKTQGLKPKINNKINKYLCVSDGAGKEWEELTGIKPILCRNPLQITEEEKKETIYLISATRLTKEKGKDRMIKLAEELNKANINYLWLVFTNDTNAINNENVIYMKPRLNIRPYIASIKGKGYGVQLSDCEGDCYFTRECEGLGVPLIVTPIPSFKEQGLEEGKNCYYMPFDMEEIKVNRLLNIPSYEPYIVQDNWINILVKSKSKYKEELKMKFLVRATDKYEKTNTFDAELSKEKGITSYIPKAGEEWEVEYTRKEHLLELGFITVVKEIKAKEVETAVKKPKAEKAVKKTTKKSK